MSETALRTAAWVCSSRPGCDNQFRSWRHSCAASLPSKETCTASVSHQSFTSSRPASCSRSAQSALTWLLAISWLSKLLKLCTALALPAVSAAAANCITSALICPRWPAMPAMQCLLASGMPLTACAGLCKMHPAALQGLLQKWRDQACCLQSDSAYPHSSYKPASYLMTLHGGQASIAMAERMHNRLTLGLGYGASHGL